MGRVYIGENPCPGCGKKGVEARRSYKDGICWNCLSDLKKFKEFEQRTAGRSDKLVKFRVVRHEIKYLTGHQDYSNLIKAIEGLLIKLDIPDGEYVATEKLYYGSYYSESFSIGRVYKRITNNGELLRSDSEDFIIREDIAIQLHDLIKSIENLSKTAFQKGVEHGASLLQGLASERISPSDFYEILEKRKY